MADDDKAPEADGLEGVPHPRETAVLFGHGEAEALFVSALNGGRLAHGWMIAGPRGIGKATLAYRIARTMIAGVSGLFGGPDSLHMDPEDPVFRRIAARGEPRLRVLKRPVNPRTGRLQTVVTVDEVRAVKDFLQLSSPDGGWRVVIVDPVDEMNIAAQNALLKLLEEPPAQTLLLLVSHAPGRLLPTIRSRVRRLELGPLEADALEAALTAAGVEIPAGTEAPLKALAEGSVGDAVRLLAVDGPDLYGEIIALFRQDRLDRPGLIRLAESATGRDAEPRYDAILRLTIALTARLARAAAGAAPVPASEAEAGIFDAQSPGDARRWAEAASRIARATAEARSVNLDPAQVILDTFLDLDAVWHAARMPA